MADREVALKERQLDAEVRKQADAMKYKMEKEAEANLIRRQKDAEAKRFEQEQAAEAAKRTAEAAKYSKADSIFNSASRIAKVLFRLAISVWAATSGAGRRSRQAYRRGCQVQ